MEFTGFCSLRIDLASVFIVTHFNMTNLITTFLNICLLREGPEVLPSSQAFLATMIVISLGVSILIGSMVYDVTGAMLTSFAGLFLSFVFVRLLLLKRPERFLQTFSAILGTVALINIISIPTLSLIHI